MNRLEIWCFMNKPEIGKYYKFVDSYGDWSIFKLLNVNKGRCEVEIVESSFWSLGLYDFFISVDKLSNEGDLLKGYNTPLWKLLNGDSKDLV